MPLTKRERVLLLGTLMAFAAYYVPKTIGPSLAGLLPAPSVGSAPDFVPRIAIAYDAGGRADPFNEAAWQGIQRAGDRFDAEYKEVFADPGDTDADRETRLGQLARAAYYPIFVIGPSYAGAVARVAPKFPDSWFSVIDDGSVNADNVVGILFHEEQGSFLVGAAAALTSKTGAVGFIGAVRDDRYQRYEAGFVAGARAADPGIAVSVAYLAAAPLPGDPATPDASAARSAAVTMYEAGVDVIFAAAGDASSGVFQVAHDSRTWAIGADGDAYLTADPSVRSSILTSMMKRADAATFTVGMEIAQDVAKDGTYVFGLESGAVGYSTSGGFVDAIKAQLDAFAAKVASGQILVPTKP